MSLLSADVLTEIFEISKNIIGEKTVRAFQKRLKKQEINDVPSIIFELATEIEDIYGKHGAHAVLRELGREYALRLMKNYPEEEWEKIFEEALKIKGFAEGIKREDTRACIRSCIFYPLLEKKNLKPTEHPVCWIGWGFVEEFMKAFTGALGVKWVGRDNKKRECYFQIITPEDI